MFNVKTFLRQAAAALVLAGSSLAALAAPISFHVDLNTGAAGLPAKGFVDLQLGSLSTAAPLTVTLSNFTGAFGVVDYIEGNVTLNPDGSYTLANLPAPVSLLSFAADFGGLLGFDVRFSDDLMFNGGTDGVIFTVGLLDEFLAPVGGAAGFASFELRPDVGLVPDVTGNIVTMVPEPSDWLLMMTGFALLGLALRRRAA